MRWGTTVLIARREVAKIPVRRVLGLATREGIDLEMGFYVIMGR